jgi:multisubunit Na+/H+ antiporter MnhB subunit
VSRRDRLRTAGLSALPLLPALVLYGVLAAGGAVPAGVLPALAVALAAQAAITYVRTPARRADGHGPRTPRRRRGL